PGLAEPTRESSSSVTLPDFVAVWMPLIETAHESVRERLRSILQALQTADAAGDATALKAGITDLNQLLLQQVAQLPLTIDVAGATTTGPQRTHNEDACYPSLQDLYQRRAEAEDFLLPYLGIICDGIGGHEGGEVASQRALEDLKTLTRNLLNEFLSQPELLLPETVSQQLESVVRVVNNVIANQNDEQGRELRQRMGTTLVMALQLPQQVDTARGKQNAHELYLVTVGDSRAYWLTPRYCHRLTVDDDVATREVRMGRSVYQTALERPDGGALTQAIGTRDAEALNPTVQRFVIEESGLLLLCSDGLSDNDRVEQNWEDVTRQVFKGRLALEDAVQMWLGIANEQNGHDNTSVVLMRFQVGEAIKLVQPEVQVPPPASPVPVPDELTEASRALLYDEESDPDATQASPAPAREPIATPASNKQPASLWIWLALLGLVACFAGIIGVIWYNSQQTQPIPQTAPQQTPQQTP
ncbi:MAG TPA: PP2C family serine/threonine-protein phosphatase, partial [Allocoleopsis sp.]